MIRAPLAMTIVIAKCPVPAGQLNVLGPWYWGEDILSLDHRPWATDEPPNVLGLWSIDFCSVSVCPPFPSCFYIGTSGELYVFR